MSKGIEVGRYSWTHWYGMLVGIIREKVVMVDSGPDF